MIYPLCSLRVHLFSALVCVVIEFHVLRSVHCTYVTIDVCERPALGLYFSVTLTCLLCALIQY